MLRLSISFFIPLILVSIFSAGSHSYAATLKAGTGRMNITDKTIPANDSLYVKALVLDDGYRKIAIITLDAKALAEIGPVKNDFVSDVRNSLKKDPGIEPENVLINVSHCHGAVIPDVESLTIMAVRAASRNLVPVTTASGTGYEDRIMESRRMILKSGREADSRHAYPLPPDNEVVSAGPADPEIGILRINRKDGTPLAVLYNFGIHPIQGVPGKENTADITGFSSKVIEDFLGNGAMAFFVQGCAGDVNPVLYKDVHNPRDAEPLGNMLGLSVTRSLAGIKADQKSSISVLNETVFLPRANLASRIESLQLEQIELLKELKGTSLNFRTFYELLNKYSFSPSHPSGYSHRYIHDSITGRKDLLLLDSENRRNIESYLRNIHIMEQLTRNNINLDLLKKHHADNQASGSDSIQVEVMGIRIGKFYMISFPGELSSQTGLNIKKNSPHALTFLASISNGYIYYTPTEEQLKNCGYAQEDSDCIVGPGWQRIFEEKANDILKRLD